MVKKEEKNIYNTELKNGDDYLVEARKVAGARGVTDLYSFGDRLMDEYMGGGWGRSNGYELICIFGDTGQNKSTLLSQMVITAAARGAQVAYMALEDEMYDVINRIDVQISVPGKPDDEEKLKHRVLDNIDFTVENDGYTLNILGDVIENLFCTHDVVVIDPIQFVFEASVADRAEAEYNRQRVFMRRLNNIMKKTGKTLIFVSHTNKSGNAKERADAGMMKIQGSGALQQICSKVIEIGRSPDGVKILRLWKSRFTAYRRIGLQVQLDTKTMRISTPPYTNLEMNQMRESW